MIEIARIAGPLTAWLATFSGLYGLHGVVCSERWTAFGLDAATGRVALLVAGGLACAMQVGLLALLRRPGLVSPSPTLRRTGLALGVVALIATVWTLVPVVTTSICA